MNTNQLDNDLIALVEKKTELSQMQYNDERYDEVEDELHQMEDEFLSHYGTYLEEAFHVVHDEFCPDNDVLLPIAYLAKKYQKTKEKRNGKPTYDVSQNEGVLVDADDYPNMITRLVLVPNPTRILLLTKSGTKEVVWQVE
ncbi:hypothetical protein SAMN05421823_106262 [Catalinimonas alkaloidigena]|uniref:Uncharacterized protein n=1 Tax=Catalinimonas alkaloidigena TaxID=1075417 RepID=A0A1G9KVK2_9BACT|nr:hypothetical protein [Catalinimonas alkaloidigena]SDL53497.1 hypothetical protein SAMN05421823_106262 [Catalinimonas alkaloidigena]